jgi:hypothetical protein
MLCTLTAYVSLSAQGSLKLYRMGPGANDMIMSYLLRIDKESYLKL